MSVVKLLKKLEEEGEKTQVSVKMESAIYYQKPDRHNAYFVWKLTRFFEKVGSLRLFSQVQESWC